MSPRHSCPRPSAPPVSHSSTQRLGTPRTPRWFFWANVWLQRSLGWGEEGSRPEDRLYGGTDNWTHICAASLQRLKKYFWGFSRLQEGRDHKAPYQHPQNTATEGHWSLQPRHDNDTRPGSSPATVAVPQCLGVGTCLGAPPLDLTMKMLENFPEGRVGGAKTRRTKSFQKFRSVQLQPSHPQEEVPLWTMTSTRGRDSVDCCLSVYIQLEVRVRMKGSAWSGWRDSILRKAGLLCVRNGRVTIGRDLGQ